MLLGLVWAVYGFHVQTNHLPFCIPHYYGKKEFLQHIWDNLCSLHHPAGSITNSDLDLADNLVQQDIMAQEVDLTESNVAIGTDNQSTTIWCRNFSSTSSKTRSYLL